MDLKREELQILLEVLLDSNHVYFQPPQTVEMQYPCIVYQRDNADTRFAGNVPYRHEKRYLVTLISRNPDDDTYGKIAALPKCLFQRHFVADSLNHDAFTLYY